ncbi:MAG TPA: PEP-CTERM sorting domain-containing protein [Casimicrobiaceae bacterium]|nr:PEP-CTERM sorting domain-containing protein [Casimicrobiaceae bacterium]
MSTLMKYIASCGLWACSTLVVAGNLIANGDFSAGNVGFGSQYAFAAADDCMPPGIYDIVARPGDCHPYWASFGDHTSGDGSMMAINGAASANTEVWSDTVSVVPETQYYFSTWIASSHPTSPAMLDFSINGASIGTTFAAAATPGLWQQFYTSWYSGANTTAQLSLVNQNTIFYGNDFALDDITFDTLAPTLATDVGNDAPEPASWPLLAAAIGACLVASSRKRRSESASRR